MSEIGRHYSNRPETEPSYLQKRGKAVVRVFPIDDYDPHLNVICDHATDYHFLWMPLLGQYYAAAGMPKVLCGKTAPSMIYNFFLLAQGDPDVGSKYITHWDGGHTDWKVDPRFPNGDRAFSNLAVTQPAALGDGGTMGIGDAASGAPPSALRPSG